jgi:hypothetical protein
MARDIQSEESKALDQVEHNSDGSSKRVSLRLQDPNTGSWVNIGAQDNGDGTFSMMTTGAAGGFAPISNYDYVDIQQTSATVDTFVFKLGGSGGTTVRTVVITYTDSTKNDMDTVEFSA